MLHTKMKLVNEPALEELLMDIVRTAYDQIKNLSMLLSVEHEMDVLIATEGHETFDNVIKENFILDEFDDIEDQKGYQQLIDDLQVAFVAMHKSSGLFDYFPAGEYEVNGEKRYQPDAKLAPVGRFIAPFEDAVMVVH